MFNTFEFDIMNRGQGNHGELGHHNRMEDELTPTKVETLADEIIVDVTCGHRYTCVVTSTGKIYTWGHVFGKVTVLKPELLQDLSSKGVVSVSANEDHTACVTQAGEVCTWGYGCYGKLGHGDERNQETPKRIETLTGVKAALVSCGVYRTVVCTEDGHTYTFGLGKFGVLGHGDTKTKTSPALVLALEGKHITQLQCCYTHTMALTSSGYVFTWGYGLDCQPSHKTISTIPYLVEAIREHNVVQITSDSQHCAVLVDPSPSLIRQSQQASFNNKQHSDVVFMVENQPIYAYVDVLTDNSDYFSAMFRSKMRESLERVVKVPDCSRAAFLQVLKYLCLDDFTVNIDNAVELWSLADMYQLEGLKYTCIGAFERGLCENNVLDLREEVKGLSCACYELKILCHKFIAEKRSKDEVS